MDGNRELASWLITQRLPIERAMAARLGPAAPAAGAPETETLRRFRSFASSALSRGKLATPALDGLRINERRVTALLHAWTDAAAQLAGARSDELVSALLPLIEHFRTAVRATDRGRVQRGRPRATRRAVVAAIDRVSDAFLAIDALSCTIEDANPAAGSMLGLQRDALLGVDAMSFIPRAEQAEWRTQLEGVSEGDDRRQFDTALIDVNGRAVAVDATVTRFSTRGRTLALVMARPRPQNVLSLYSTSSTSSTSPSR